MMRREQTTIAHLTASRGLGGPERQMLGLAGHVSAEFRSVFLSFAEGGRAGAFVNAAKDQGSSYQLVADTPFVRAMVAELRVFLKHLNVALLCCHGYKAIIVGMVAAWRTGIPVIVVARGWTAETLKVRLYEALALRYLRFANRLVTVSQSQADELAASALPIPPVAVIRNAIDVRRFRKQSPGHAAWLRRTLPGRRLLIGAAGRLVREKGYQDLIEIAGIVTQLEPDVGFVLFGDGPERGELERQIRLRRLGGHFALAGFRSDVDRLLPGLDAFVHPSHREGLPNAVLEACAAGVPVIATDVGGTREVIRHGENGFLTPAGQGYEMVRHILELARSPELRRAIGTRARARVASEFSFQIQSRSYAQLFRQVLGGGRRCA